MGVFIDQTGRQIEINPSPKKIISLVPSQTELLYSLGLEEEVIGITKFCVHPSKWFRSKTRIGGTKQLNLEKIRALDPDLIIANKEENNKEQIEDLADDIPTWISDVNNLEGALNMIRSIGMITNKKNHADKLVGQIKKAFDELKEQRRPIKSCYLIWKEPFMTAGGDTFINDMMKIAGFDNQFATLTRYPEITLEQIKNSSCEVLILSSEPYPFIQKHADELQQQLAGKRVILADGQFFSWYGSRLLDAPAYFNKVMDELFK